MERRHGKEIAKETSEVSKEDKKIVKDITRRMSESFNKTLQEQQQIISDARKQRPEAQYFKNKIDEAFKRVTKETLAICIEKTNKIQGRSPEAEAQRRAIYAEYEKKVENFTKLRDDLTKAAER